MNKTGIRESFEMFEMLRDVACMIDHFTDYISHSQDPQLRQLLERQQRLMVDEYQQKMSIIQSHGLDVSNIPRFHSAASGQGQNYTGAAGVQGTGSIGGMYEGTALSSGMQQQGMMHAHPQNQPMQQPYQQQSFRTLNDRSICQGALLFHKCGATRATTAALESAEPHLRELAAKSARSCMDMAYEVFRFMEQKGYYQSPAMPSSFVNHMQGTQTQMGQGMQHHGFSGGQGIQGH